MMIFINNFNLIILVFCAICCSSNTHENSKFSSEVIVDSVLFERGITELSPLIEKYSCKFHYENGTFGLSFPFVGSFFLIDSLGSFKELTSNYSIEDLKSPSLRMTGVSFNGDLFGGKFYSYFFSKIDEIKILDINTGGLSKVPSNINGSVLHSDVYKVSDRILFSRYGKLGNDLVFQVMQIKDSNTALLHTIDLDGPMKSFPPFLTFSHGHDFYFLRQESDSLFKINLKKGVLEFSKKLRITDILSKDFLSENVAYDVAKISYSEFRVFNDTMFMVTNKILIDSIGEKNIKRILTIEAKDSFQLVDLPDTFLGLGPYLNYYSLEYSDSQRFLFLRPITDFMK